MKVKFLMDFGKHKAGDVVDVPEAEAEDHHQAGRAFPFVEPAPKPKPALETKPKAATRRKRAVKK